MNKGADYFYKAFVLSYLQNAVDKFRICRNLDIVPSTEKIMLRGNAITSIVFSAMTLEAFINHCIDQFLESLPSSGYSVTATEQLRDYFNDLRIKDKWKELFKHRDPNFIEGIAKDWNEYGELIRLRNNLVHSKQKNLSTFFNPIENLRTDDARKALSIVNRMMTHGTRIFAEFVPSETYIRDTFEPALKRIFPEDLVPISRILDEPCQVAASAIPSFDVVAPKEYAALLDMHDLVPPDQFPIFRVEPLVFSSSSNDGIAKLSVIGYKLDSLGVQ